MKVALFITCLVDGLVPEVGRSTVRLLKRLGVHVDLPLTQSCCGQMHVNTGYPRAAVPLVRNYAATFGEYDAVVTPSGSCAAAVRHQHTDVARLTSDDALTSTVDDIGRRTFELSEFLLDVLGVTDVGAHFPHRVTYHPTCHSLRLLRVGDRPIRLLRDVDELDLVELPDAESCCGFGGTFAVKNPAVSAAILADKTTAIASTRAEVCTAGDASCLVHIGGGLSRGGFDARAVHLAQILASTRDEPWTPAEVAG